ncbi:MAG: type II toxin-antitoxin system RelE/ParE family toxin [Tannerella sp.]|jgi:phage-related protein|nr:type II toxin-antitoxin system RelE/ParE family toxin [Tannerella sp.]
MSLQSETKNYSIQNYFQAFFDSLEESVQNKILYVLMLLETQDRIPLKFMRIIDDSLYELRIEYESNNIAFSSVLIAVVVILFNGFQKKTQKTPKGEIEKAKKIKKEYNERKGR